MIVPKNRELRFDLYRFQIVPNSTQEGGLFDLPLEEVITRKNEFFGDILSRKRKKIFSKRHDGIATKTVANLDGFTVFRLGNKKHKRVQNKNLEKIEVEDYPDVYVLINNDPEVQTIAISKNIDAFSESLVVAGILEKSFAVPLAAYQLSIYIQPVFEEKSFWSLVKRYEGKIKSLKFDLIKPNLANISGSFRNEIRSLADNVNSHRTEVKLNAPKEAALENVNEENGQIDDLVKYASKGGGEISVRVKGMSKTMKTNKSIKEITISEMTLKGEPEEVVEALKTILR